MVQIGEELHSFKVEKRPPDFSSFAQLCRLEGSQGRQLSKNVFLCGALRIYIFFGTLFETAGVDEVCEFPKLREIG